MHKAFTPYQKKFYSQPKSFEFKLKRYALLHGTIVLMPTPFVIILKAFVLLPEMFKRLP